MPAHRREPEITRRQLLGLGLAGSAVVAADALLAPPAVAHPHHTERWPARGRGTTLQRTLLRGSPGAGGYRHIVVGPGEPHLRRVDLLPPGLAPGAGHRRERRRALIALGQLTDMHVLDAQSPARVEFLDRYDDPGSPYASLLPFEGAYRAHEMLTAHVAEAMVRGMRRVRRAPVTGLPLAFAITTGDNVDNTQYNELRWQIDLLDGGTIRPDSGSTSKYEGVADLVSPDPFYWHPDGAAPGGSPDLRISQLGFPTVPGLLDACRAPFDASGIGLPWLSVFGNHDGLVQGNLPSNPVVAGLATGPVKITGLPAGVDIIQLAIGLQSGDPAALQTLFSGPFRFVTPDANRRPLSRAETIAEHFITTGEPFGHGYTDWNRQTGNAYYAFDRGRVRGIVLDTVNPFGGSEGSIDTAQLAWLEDQLQSCSRHHLDTAGNVVRGRGPDKLIVLFSHHTIGTMTNGAGIGRVLGPEVQALLLRYPNVVLWVNGHTHRNTVTAYARGAGSAVPGGFWEVNTAAHIDWPQQSRVVELVDNGDGTLSIYGTLLDHDGPASWSANPSTPLELAGLSRELAANDWQAPAGTGDEDGRRGAPEDRNVELLLPAPFALAGH